MGGGATLQEKKDDYVTAFIIMSNTVQSAAYVETFPRRKFLLLFSRTSKIIKDQMQYNLTCLWDPTLLKEKKNFHSMRAACY